MNLFEGRLSEPSKGQQATVPLPSAEERLQRLSVGSKGTWTEKRAQLWLLEQGYEVFENITPHGVADLVYRNPETGELVPVDVTTGQWSTKADGTKSLKTKSRPDVGVRYLVSTPEGAFEWMPAQEKVTRQKARPEEATQRVAWNSGLYGPKNNT